MKALANAGHEVTVVSPFPVKEPIKNYHDVYVDNFGMDVNMFETEDWTPMQMMMVLSGLGEFYSNSTLNSPNMQELMKSGKKFDAVIVEVFWAEALYGLGAHFNAPLIALSTFSTSKWTNDLTKAPMEYAYVPHNFIKFTEDMNFYQRAWNTLVSQFENLFMEFVHYKRQVGIELF